MFEGGERIDILGPLHGDTELVARLHIPALDTVIAADLLFDGTHAWMLENTTSERLERWRSSLDSLDSLEAIGAAYLIPGHIGGAPSADGGLAHPRAYLDQWETAMDSTSSAEDLRAALMAGNETLSLTFAVDRAIAAVYPEG